jgi:heme/copper-type cytochrome/quinol oxidase subunit 2
MRSAVTVDEEKDYKTWLDEQSTFAALYPDTANGPKFASAQEPSVKNPVITANKTELESAIR